MSLISYFCDCALYTAELHHCSEQIPIASMLNHSTAVCKEKFNCHRFSAFFLVPASVVKAFKRPCSSNVLIFTIAMASRGRGFTRGRGAAREQRPVARPDAGERFPKFALAPYATSSGAPFFLPRDIDEKTLLSLQNIASTRWPKNSEAVCLRLGLALSESAGCMEMGAIALETTFGGSAAKPGKFHQTFTEMAEWFSSEAGKALLSAAATLNKSNGGPKNEEAMSDAIAKWLKGFKELKERVRSVRKIAQVSARAYLWSMDVLENLAMLSHPDTFFEKVDAENPVRDLDPVRRFLKKPSDAKLLRKAMEATYQKQVLQKGLRAEKRGLSSSDSASKKKKAKKDKKDKHKKTKKRSRSTSSSTSSKSGSRKGRKGSDSSSRRSSSTRSSSSEKKKNTDERRGRAETRKQNERREKESRVPKEKGLEKGAESEALKKRMKAKAEAKKDDEKKEDSKKKRNDDEGKDKKKEKKDKEKKDKKEKKTKKEKSEEESNHKDESEEEKSEAKKPRREAPLSSEVEDAASSEVSEEDNDVYEEWGAKDIQFFATAVEEACVAKEATNKKDRLKLEMLVSIMDNIPDKVLQKHMLADILTTLKQMERLPKKDKVNTILESLQELASKAMAICPPDYDNKAEAAAREAEEIRAAAFASWPQDKVQQLVCKVGNEQTQVGALADGKFDKQTIMDLVKDVPEEVQALSPELQGLVEKARQEDGDVIPNLLAKQILRKLAQVAGDVESWYEQQASAYPEAANAK